MVLFQGCFFQGLEEGYPRTREESHISAGRIGGKLGRLGANQELEDVPFRN